MWSTLNDLHSANYPHAGLKLGCKAVTDAHEWYLQSGERKKNESHWVERLTSSEI